MKLIFDSNILLLLIVGSIGNQKYLQKNTKHKRLSSYGISHYDKAYAYFVKFTDKIYITSYIAAEVSNLIGMKGEDRKEAFMKAKLFFSNFHQIQTRLSEDVDGPDFSKRGLADNSLLSLCKDYTILTDDEDLFNGIISINTENVISIK